VISKVSTHRLGRLLRASLLVVAAALVIVPTVARARQQVDRRDATRLSIKHSWVGVAPPTKASTAPAAVAILPPTVTRADAAGITFHACIVRNIALPGTVHGSRDPLRGPPSNLS
jgi:hypothetical protein